MAEFSDDDVTRSTCMVCETPTFWQTDTEMGGPAWQHAISFMHDPHTPVCPDSDIPEEGS